MRSRSKLLISIFTILIVCFGQKSYARTCFASDLRELFIDDITIENFSNLQTVTGLLFDRLVDCSSSADVVDRSVVNDLLEKIVIFDERDVREYQRDYTKGMEKFNNYKSRNPSECRYSYYTPTYTDRYGNRRRGRRASYQGPSEPNCTWETSKWFVSNPFESESSFNQALINEILAQESKYKSTSHLIQRFQKIQLALTKKLFELLSLSRIQSNFNFYLGKFKLLSKKIPQGERDRFALNLDDIQGPLIEHNNSSLLSLKYELLEPVEISTPQPSRVAQNQNTQSGNRSSRSSRPASVWSTENANSTYAPPSQMRAIDGKYSPVFEKTVYTTNSNSSVLRLGCNNLNNARSSYYSRNRPQAELIVGSANGGALTSAPNIRVSVEFYVNRNAKQNLNGYIIENRGSIILDNKLNHGIIEHLISGSSVEIRVDTGTSKFKERFSLSGSAAAIRSLGNSCNNTF